MTILLGLGSLHDNDDDGAMDSPAVIFIVLSTCIGVTNVVLNSVILVAVFKHKYYDIYTREVVLIVNLALANLVEGVALPTIDTIHAIHLELLYQDCFWLNLAMVVFTDLSHTMVVIIACERFTVSRNLRYHGEPSDLKWSIVIAVMGWLFAIGSGILPFLYSTYHYKSNYINTCYYRAVISIDFDFYFEIVFKYLGSLFVMTFVYIHLLTVDRICAALALFKRSRRHRRRPFDITQSNPVMLIIVLLVFIVTHTPIALLYFAEFNQLNMPWGRSDTRILKLTAVLIKRSNGFWNPFIYAASNPWIKDAIHNVVFKTDTYRTSFSTWITTTCSSPDIAESQEHETHVTPQETPIATPAIISEGGSLFSTATRLFCITKSKDSRTLSGLIETLQLAPPFISQSDVFFSRTNKGSVV